MKSNKEPENQRVVKDKKKATIGTAAHDDGLQGPKNPAKAEPITQPVVATPEGTLEQPKRPS